jgi:Spy/CpxP family protein refolding chaperone
MKRNRILAAATLAGLLAVGSSALYAFDGRCGEGPHGHGGFGPVGAAYHLDNLTADQRKQLDDLRDKQRKAFEQSRDEHQALRKQIWETTDPKALRPLADKEGKFVADMIMQRAETRTAVEKILTPEQREQLKKEYQERRNDRHGGKGDRW